MDTKADVQEIADWVDEMESSQELLNRIFEILVAKCTGEELLELDRIMTEFNTLNEGVHPEEFVDPEDPDVIIDPYSVGAAFTLAAEKVFPTLAALRAFGASMQIRNPDGPGWLFYDTRSGKEKDELYVLVVDHDRAHPGDRSIADRLRAAAARNDLLLQQAGGAQ